MKTLLTLRRSVLGAVLLGSALALSATPNSGGVSVKYSDVDLSSPQGAAVLYERITKAARRVCDSAARKDLHDLRLYEACYQGAVANAVGSVSQLTCDFSHQHLMIPARTIVLDEVPGAIECVGFGGIIANADRDVGVERTNCGGARRQQGGANCGFQIVGFGSDGHLRRAFWR